VRSTQNPALLDAVHAAGAVRRLLRQAATDLRRLPELAAAALKALPRVEGPAASFGTGPLRDAVLADVRELREALTSFQQQTSGSGDFLDVLAKDSEEDGAQIVEHLESLTREIVRRLTRMYRHGDVAGTGPARSAA
jgi:Mg2+ and Co2+ transporter CorA